MMWTDDLSYGESIPTPLTPKLGQPCYLGGGGSSAPAQPTETTTTQRTTPWAPAANIYRSAIFPTALAGMFGGPYVDYGQLFQNEPGLVESLAKGQDFTKAIRGYNLSPYITDFQYPEFFPGSTVVPFSGQTQQALDLTEQRALGGSPLTPAAQQAALGILGGQAANPAAGYFENLAGGLDVNPYLDQAYQAASAPLLEQFEQRVMPAITGQFAGAGRYGSGLHAQELSRAGGQLTDSLAALSAGIYGPGYEAAQNRALQAAQGLGDVYNQDVLNVLRASGMAPQLAQQDYADISQLFNVGGAYEDLAARQLQDEMARFAFEQQFTPGGLLSQYGGYIQPFGGTSTTTTGTANFAPQTAGGNPLLSGLGGAALGYAATPLIEQALWQGVPYALPALGPWGAVAGGALGLLGGMMF